MEPCFTQLPFNVESRASKLWVVDFLIFGLVRLQIELEYTVRVANFLNKAF